MMDRSGSHDSQNKMEAGYPQAAIGHLQNVMSTPGHGVPTFSQMQMSPSVILHTSPASFLPPQNVMPGHTFSQIPIQYSNQGIGPPRTSDQGRALAYLAGQNVSEPPSYGVTGVYNGQLISPPHGQMMSPPNVGGALPSRQGGVDITDELKRLSEDGLEENISSEVFSGYRAKAIIPGAKPHPGNIVEASSLSAVPLPQATYNLAASIPSVIVSESKLSSLQLEGIHYACQRHQTILPDGNRAGFFIGDAAGVGKGRQIAGLILDNYARGRKKHIWFSISADLKVDAQRDFHDLGCHIKVIEGCQQLDRETRAFGLPSGLKFGVIFSTYSTLVSSVSRGGAMWSSRHSRLQQLIDWCGKESFDGCLIFDECHKAKNFIPGKEKNSTKIAMAVISIQRMLPKARVVYCSATGVSDVKNMAFMERLGLWGEGAPFKSFDHFLNNINRRGLGAAEMLAMELKSSGMYVSRGLSFQEAEFVTIETNLTPEQERMYDLAAHVWNEVRKAMENALTRTNTSGPRVWSFYWSSHQRFFKQLCLGVKVPCIVAEAKKALEEGCCVVIGLQSTGEASLDSQLSKGELLSDFVSTAREILSRFIEQHFPVKVIPSAYEIVRDEEWCLQAKNLLLSFAEKIELPKSALDDVIDQLGGSSCVAEMTGRKGRMVRRQYGSRSVVEYEGRYGDTNDVNSLNVQERNSFMQGRKLVAVISDAASTGISLHSDTRVANQRRRVHLTIELPWSADKAVQQLGRSHRSNQSSGPLYKLLTTNLGGERRFASAVARRLQSLGALTQGDRRAASGADLTQFNFDTPYGRTGLRNMYAAINYSILVPGVPLANILQGNASLEDFNRQMQECVVLMGFNSQAMEKDNRDVGKFLNRILGLKVEKQNLIFNYFCECLQAVIEASKKEGKYNEGMVDITASSITVTGTPTEVFKDATKSAPTRHVSLKVDRGLTWEAAKTRADNYSGNRDGFYKSRHERFGRYFYLLATQKPGSRSLFKLARPNTGLSIADEEISDLLTRYKPISEERAEKGWKELYEYSLDHCIHGSQCKQKGICTVGSRQYKLDLLCGGILTIMSTLENTLNMNASQYQLSKAVINMRVVRVQLDNGDRLIGLRYPAVLLPLVEETLRQQKIVEKVQSKLNTDGTGIMLDPASLSNGEQKQCIIEPESVVNPKNIERAMTAPPTLKNFFKKVDKETFSEISEKIFQSGRKTEKETTGSEVKNSKKSSRKPKKELVKDEDGCFVIDDGGESGGKRKRRSLGKAGEKKRRSLESPSSEGSEKENHKIPKSAGISGNILAGGIGSKKCEELLGKMDDTEILNEAGVLPSENAPSSSENVPSMGENVPSSSENVPLSKNLQSLGEKVPSVCETVCENVLSVCENVPSVCENVECENKASLTDIVKASSEEEKPETVSTENENCSDTFNLQNHLDNSKLVNKEQKPTNTATKTSAEDPHLKKNKKSSKKNSNQAVVLLQCPLCQTVLPPGTLNIDLNKHIDRCLQGS